MLIVRFFTIPNYSTNWVYSTLPWLLTITKRDSMVFFLCKKKVRWHMQIFKNRDCQTKPYFYDIFRRGFHKGSLQNFVDKLCVIMHLANYRISTNFFWTSLRIVTILLYPLFSWFLVFVRKIFITKFFVKLILFWVFSNNKITRKKLAWNKGICNVFLYCTIILLYKNNVIIWCI